MLKNNLKIFREKKGFTQAEIANKLNISIMTYFRYESGERIPNVCIAQQLAKTLNTTIEELFPLSGTQQNNQLNNNIRKEK